MKCKIGKVLTINENDNDILGMKDIIILYHVAYCFWIEICCCFILWNEWGGDKNKISAGPALYGVERSSIIADTGGNIA